MDAMNPNKDKSQDQVANENWTRYRYCVRRNHRDYMDTAKMLEGFYLGGDYDGQGILKAGGQWSEADLAILQEQKRPAYEVNEIQPAIKAAIGYQINNRMDISFKPKANGANANLAHVRSKVAMHIASQNQFHWKETEVFGDGLIQRRGYYDIRMCFDDSILGELSIETLDPFDVIPDPDAKSYNPKHWSDVIVTRWLTADEIAVRYGEEAQKLAEEYQHAETDNDFGVGDESEVERNHFGEEESTYDSQYGDAKIKRYRVIDRQYWVRGKVKCAVYSADDVRVLQGDETPEQLAQMEANGAFITERMGRKVRWTVSIQSKLLKDDWSPYDRFTVVPYFPLFRRGKSRGMVDPAIGSQKILNKGLSQATHIINTTANSGWQLEENQLTNMTVDELEQKGAQTGLVLERRAGSPPIQKITPNTMPNGLDVLIKQAMFNIKEVTVPDAMRGNTTKEVSGIAIQSKQHAAQQNLAMALDNLTRTRHMVSEWIDYAITKYYTSERIIRITKSDPVTGKELDDFVTINKFDGQTYQNDMTVGEYDIVITEQPVQVTFENSQFTQIMEMRTAGINLPDRVAIKYSNLTEKDEIIEEMANSQAPDPIKEAEVALKRAQARLAEVNAVNKSIEATYSATQSATQIAMNPAIAPVADKLMRSSGFQDMDAAPIVSAPEQAMQVQGEMPTNTNPLTPANPAVGMNAGIETPDITTQA